MPKPAYSFLPWLRQGLAGRLDLVDELGLTESSGTTDAPTIDLSLQVKGDGQAISGGQIKKTVRLYGPGDVIGIEARAVIKTQPWRGTIDFEPNYLPYIEFYEEDFPWRYTPLKNNGDRLRPWLMLVVLKASEFENNPVQKGDVLPSFTLKTRAENAFPPAGQVWAWAHAHVNQSLGLEGIHPKDEAEKNQAITGLGDLISKQPNRSCSRILCPVKLQPETAYHAFLIPTFEQGRLAGLGRKTEEIEAVPVQMPAWGQNPRQNQFPYYYNWEFRTGRAEDFEELIRRIEPRRLDEKVGRRWIDLQDPGYLIHYNDTAIGNETVPEPHLLKDGAILMEGALRSPGPTLPSFLSDSADKDATWLDHLESLLNLDAKLRERDVPPDHPFAQNPYFRPTDDTTTEVGADTLQAPVDIYDDPLILPPLYGRWHARRDRADRSEADHWFNQLNLDPRHRIAAGFGAEVVRRNQEDYMDRAWKQYESLFETNDYLRKIAFSVAVNEGLMNRHFRQMQSWQLTTISEGVQTVVRTDQGNNLRGYIHPRPVPDALLTAASEKIGHPNRTILRRSRRHQSFSQAAGTRSRSAGTRTGLPDLDSVGDLKPLKATPFEEFKMKEPETTGDYVHQTLQAFGFGFMVTRALSNLEHSGTKYRRNYFGISGIDDGKKSAFYKALKQLNDRIRFDDEALLTDQPGNLVFRTTGTFILHAIEPTAAFTKKVKNTVQYTDTRGELKSVAKLLPILQHPIFPDAMYEPLEAIASQHLVPNLDLIPPNTYALMETNRAFIEAYMAGVNFEMARELLWREFPTDQRGTYFKRFWAAREGLTTPQIVEDIDAMHEWQDALGEHPSPDNPVGGKKRMVLVIRADLLKRYPNVVIYLQEAKKDPNTKERVLGPDIQMPAFFAQIQPDIYIVGFDTTVKKAKKDLGHFFVIRERPGELRFGMDLPLENEQEKTPKTIWNDLHWGELFGNHKYIDLTQDKPLDKSGREAVPWVSLAEGHAARLAWILQQQPVLVAVHIETALPDEVIPENY